MKNNDLQELKPIYIHETGYSTGDEVSLIELAMILVRRKVMIAAIVIISIALGISIALYTPRTYTFSTTIEIGNQIANGTILTFEPPHALLAKLQYSYIPLILSEFKKANPDDKDKYQIKSSVPSGSNIILLEIKGTEHKADLFKNLLRSTSQKAILDHSRIYDAIRKNITSRLNKTTTELEMLKNTNDNETEVATQQNLIELYSSQLANLRNTREISPPLKSLDPTGGSRKNIVIAFTFTGLFLGIFTAFFTGFYSKVQQKIKEEK